MATEEQLVEYLKRVTTDLQETRRRLRQVEEQAQEPVAVVAMACRFPGTGRGGDTGGGGRDITSPEELWELVGSGTDAIGDFPTDRGWDLEGLYHPDPDHPGTTYTRKGGFLYDADQFDASFFGISPREALASSPQQRVLLECSWEAIERAGIDPGTLRGSRTGVYAGTATTGDGSKGGGGSSQASEGYAGNAPSLLSGRVSYTLGLEGPAVTIETACSSSLVAIHLAGQALRQGECELALAGGVTVMATPEVFTGFSRQRGLSPDGRCKAFAASADGTGWGEGAGVLVLERLSDARRNGHPVLALLRGSAINQDGASNGFTAPNGPSQQRVIRHALANARLSASEVDVVEAHGTGTVLGDSIEADAIIATYGRNRPGGRPVLLGSVKSNIGHTQGAAGVAGVIKMVLAMRHGTLPASLHIGEPTPHVEWDAAAARLLTAPEEWPHTGRPRRAGVSSFGISGTNAHVVLEQAPQPEPVAPPEAGSEASEAGPEGGAGAAPVLPWVLSARSLPALRARARELAEHADRATEASTDLRATDWRTTDRPTEPSPEPPPEAASSEASPDAAAGAFTGTADGATAADIGWSLVSTRSVFEQRAVVVGADRDELLAGVRALASGEEHPAVVGPGDAAGAGSGGSAPVLVFPGQGSQWVGMGAGLLDSSPVFADRIAACERALAPYVDWSLTDVLRGAEGAADLGRVDVVQPALWATMVALADVWAAHGVVPAAVVGHSQGEIAAACVAGALSLEDAAKIVAVRSRALRQLSGSGAMASLAVGEERAARLAERAAPEVVVAAVNGPASTVVSGPPEQVAALVAHAEAEGVRARTIDVDYASHGPLVDRITEELTERLSGVRPVRAEIAFYSTVTGTRTDTSALDGDYWVTNLRRPVRFADAVAALLADGHRVFVEASPHPGLTFGLQECFDEAGVTTATAVPTLRRDQGGPEQLVRAVSHAFTAGARVDWSPCFPQRPAPRTVPLPTYPFQRRRFWAHDGTGDGGGDPAGLGLTSADHPLLGAAVEVAEADTRLLTGRLAATGGAAWLADHQVEGTTLVPGAALVEWALRAADEVGCAGVEELALQTPLLLPASGGVRVQVVAGPADDEGRRDVRVHARPDHDDQAPWTCHAVGVLGPVGALDPEAVPPVEQPPGGLPGEPAEESAAAVWPPPGARPVELDGFYARAAAAGYGYGPAFQGLRAAWYDGTDLLAEVDLPEAAGKEPDGFGIHPALLDAALHPALLGEKDSGNAEDDGRVWLPFAWNGVTLCATGATTVRVRVSPHDGGRDGDEAGAGGGRALRLTVADPTGAPVLTAASVVLRPADTDRLRAAARAAAQGLFTLDWIPAPGAPSDEHRDTPDGDWAVLGTEATAADGTPAPDLDHYADLPALTAALDAGVPAPTAVLAPVPSADGVESDGLALAQRMLELLQGWLAEPRLAETRLVLLTRGAVVVSTEDSDAVEPQHGSGGGTALSAAAAGLWGLVRAAQAEYPEQLLLIDLDPDGAALADTATVRKAVAWAVAANEPQAALRSGRLHVPRLTRTNGRAVHPAETGTATATAATVGDAIGAVAATEDPHTTPRPLDPDGTVLITGGTGTIGGVIAEHLVRAWGVRHLLLAGRRGEEAPGAQELAGRLTELGADVRVVAADAGDAEAVARLVAEAGADRPLTGVVHAAGVLDDAVLLSQSGDRLARVWHAKATAALNLHAATAHLPLAMFVLCTSAAGVVGNAGQSGYAAANAYVDALAVHRRALGLPALSLAWGLWEQTSELTGHMTGADLARLRRSGFFPLPTAQALELFDAACRTPRSSAVAAGIDVRGLPAAEVPAMLRGLAGRTATTAARRTAAAGAEGTEPGGLAKELAGLDEAGRLEAVTELVRRTVAVVLGFGSPAEVRTEVPFKDLGFESLTAVDLRNRLSTASGLRLPTTLAFDYPTPAALSGYLCARLTGESTTAARDTTRAHGAATDEPVALVSMACRFPGGVRTPEELWDLVSQGVDAMGEFPEDRGWDLDRLFHPDPDHSGTSYADEGAFLYDAAGFDAAFFGINPREALAIDPQQRLLLETSWELLERAGIAPASLKGSRTGVFAGVMYHDYATGLATSGDTKLEGYSMLAGSGSAASGRVAYTLGFEGPTMTVDTACSSSLVAMHLAAQALRQGECELALAGGVTVMATPEVFTGFSRQRGLAPDGRCKPYAAGADGTGWGEGVGLVLLERLSDARRNGHRVLAVLRGSAVNQDGASNGLTAPNGPSQERVIRQALANARLAASDVDVVEGHGTGTTLGDPIEAQALLATYGQERAAERPLWLGSVKSNIGHTQAAAGVAGVIKMVQAMRHGVLPASLHIDEPSPHVDWESGAVRLLTEPVEWPVGERPRRAGVSSFGASGTNAHLILEQDPQTTAEESGTEKPDTEGPAGTVPWALTARRPEALRELAGRLGDVAGSPVEVGWSLLRTRSVFEQRAVVLGEERGELTAGLAALASGEPHPGLVCGSAVGEGTGPVLVFPGQGSQWVGMGVELLDSSPAFAVRLAECERALDPYVDWSLTQVLRGDGAELARVDVVQPVLWAVMVSLAAVWGEYGVTPAAVVGHSQGEIAAACVAGALSLEDGARVVALRSRALRRLAGGGAMASLGVGREQAERLVADAPGVGIAAVNGPSSTVVSGPPEPVAAVVAACEAVGERARLVDVDYASHGPQVDEIAEELREVLAGIGPRSASVAFFSTVTGARIDTATLDTEYWVTNLRRPVRFADTIETLLSEGHRVFIEASPHPVLTLGMEETRDWVGVEAAVVPTLRRGQGGRSQLAYALAQAFCAGAPVDWTAWLGERPLVDLPTYPFQHERYWLDGRSGSSQDPAGLGLVPAGHPVLGATTQLADTGARLLTGRLAQRSQPWLADHRVLDSVLVPGAALLEWALRAADEAGCGRVDELTLAAPLHVPDTGGVRIQVAVGAVGDDGRCEVAVYARTEDGDASSADERPWECHARGVLGPGPAAADEDVEGVWPPAGAEPLDLTDFYDTAAAGGYTYGPAFQGLRAAWRDGAELLAEVELPEAAGHAEGFGVHPALLDAALQSALLDGGAKEEDEGRVWLPFAWSGVSLWATGATTVRVRVTPDAGSADGQGERAVRVVVADAVGAPVLTVESVVLRAADPEQLRAARQDEADGLFRTDWTPLSAPPEAARERVVGDGDWAVLGAQQASYGNLAELTAALDAEAAVPPVVLADLATVGGRGTGLEAPDGGLRAGADVLALVQRWLAEPRLAACRLVVVTRGAVVADDADDGAELDPAAAAVWGLVRSAQSEEPDRLLLLDLGPEHEVTGTAATEAVVRALAADEPQVAARDERVLVPRLTRAGARKRPPLRGPWRLDAGTGAGSGAGSTLEAVVPVACPEVAEPPARGQVRIAVRAAGVNFRDALVSLGMAPGQTGLGSEGAGTVTEVGPGVSGLAVGDRVMGLFEGAFGPFAVADARMLTRVPEGWGWREAAAVPVVFATAWFALVDLARLRPAESVLIHAATGGVGTAAVQIARHLGAEVYATAGPGKHGVLEHMGIDAEHRASSRDLHFASAFPQVDVVLNSLTGEFVDASLRLLREGGRFLEMGKNDIRDAEEITAAHPGVCYRAFDLIPDGGPDRIGEMLAELAELFAAGTLRPAPVRAWPVARAHEALRWLGRARHIGKVVLDVPHGLDPDGTVLVTGGTGTLGSRVAEHLAEAWGVRHLLLVSRQGPEAPGAQELAERLADLGAEARIVAADVTEREAVERLVASTGPEHPLTGVVHAAGALDDGVVPALTPERLARVWAVKATAAHHLHAATAHLPLGMFVLFSSSAATLGSPGQANYAAANAYCEALAVRRQAAGLPGVALGWGLWAEASGMTGQLSDTDLARMARTGLGTLTTEQGLRLFDAGHGHGAPHLLALRLDVRTSAARSADGTPPLFRALVTEPGGAARRTAAGAGGPAVADLGSRLAGLPEDERRRVLLDVVRSHAAAVLGHAGAEAIGAETAFKDVGFDSLTAVELRNRLAAASGLRLPATFVFRHPTPAAVATYLYDELGPRTAGGGGSGGAASARAHPVFAELERLERAMARHAPGDEARERLLRRLEALVWRLGDERTDPGGASGNGEVADDAALETASDDELFELIDREVPS
ncbi:type I polyketide synthase [Streptomyces sp. RK75]|uniref:type I polyketide synthase n=1 Tax=Streptomyces sp. RK75 TaxID=2824895 RepID=UPI001B39CB8E|nr:type I polyketide synthase [Streptomyces sp. RK75]MBQ0868631.1 SDR family NAD(P)-dependent oxidoreductase [Streptomyces sp. RK75]